MEQPGDFCRVADLRAPRLRRYAFLFLAAILLLCYASVLVAPYAFSDDYFYLADGVQRGGETQRQISASGRPTYALLLSLVLHPMRNIGDLRYLRLLSVLSIALLAWSLYRTLVSAGWDEYCSLLLAVIVVMMPPFQVYAAWAVMAFYPSAALAAGGAFYLTERACAEPWPLHKWIWAGGAVLLMLLALTIHQSAAMFFWVFAAIVLFKPGAPWPSTLRRFVWYGGIVLSGLVLGFCVYKWALAFYGYRLPPSRSHLVHDGWGKALWFFRQPLMNALNVIKLSPERWLAIAVALFTAGGFCQYFRGAVKERFWQGIMAASLLPLSYLPNLVVAENWSSYRTLPALTSLVVVYVFLALWGYGKLLRGLTVAPVLTAVLGCAALASSLVAAYNVHAYFARPQLRELNLMRSQLAQQDLAQASGVYIIGAKWQNFLAPAVRYDEFGYPSSSTLWAPKSAVYLLLRELSPERINIPIELAPATGSISPPSAALVVDMRKLSSLR